MNAATKPKRQHRLMGAKLRAFPKQTPGNKGVAPRGKVSFRDSPLFGMWKDRDFDVRKFVRALREERTQRLFGHELIRH